MKKKYSLFLMNDVKCYQIMMLFGTGWIKTVYSKIFLVSVNLISAVTIIQYLLYKRNGVGTVTMNWNLIHEEI